MQKISGFYLSFLLSLVSLHALAGKTNSLQNYQIGHCSGTKCLQVQGDWAYVSNDGSMLAGARAHFKVVNLKGIVKKESDCESFAYHIRAKSLKCDNSDLKNKSSSYIIDSQIQIERINSI